MGGEKRKSEKARLRKGVSVLVSTPGRLLDHLQHTASFSLARLQYLVLDEADRLLDLGFERDISKIVQLLNAAAATTGKVVHPQQQQQQRQRVTILASATLTPAVQRLVNLSLHDPVYVQLANKPQAEIHAEAEADAEAEAEPEAEADMSGEMDEVERAHQIPTQLRQHYVIASDKRKMLTLVAFLRDRLRRSRHRTHATGPDAHDMKIIVFFATCESVDFFYALLSAAHLPADLLLSTSNSTTKNAKDDDEDDGDGDGHGDGGDSSGSERVLPCSLFKLHGNLSQQFRTSTYVAFSKSPSAILLATDVAARGIDIPRVDWIIQYDVPSDPAAYIHRIGRTARIGSDGDALLLLTPSERPYVDILTDKKRMHLDELDELAVLRTLLLPLHSQSQRPRVSALPAHEVLAKLAVLQTALEELVVQSDAKAKSDKENLKSMAMRAFQSVIRSYATHSRTTKHIFHIKNLHLGHLARNFALREPPSKFTSLLLKSGPSSSDAKHPNTRGTTGGVSRRGGKLSSSSSSSNQHMRRGLTTGTVYNLKSSMASEFDAGM
jgi:ATP-dependent RNA helicase DDX31/DBP7